MKDYLVIFCVLILFLNCEDKKNTPDNEAISVEEKTTPAEETTPEPETEEITETLHPIVNLTNNTVEEFLTEYGKNNPERFVTLETTHGNIKLELYNNTPLHRAHFIYLIKTGYLNTTAFHRVVNGFMIQGGNNDRRETARMRSQMGSYTLPAEIIHRHNRGALAAAKEYRDNPDDRSSSFEFYIVQSRSGAHHLDPNYTVFGRVISGMDVVDTIAALDTDEGDWPLYNVNINAVIKN
jgi:peptidyl-prolyl cis-trans isomerase A (cyclophilin A)